MGRDGNGNGTQAMNRVLLAVLTVVGAILAGVVIFAIQNQSETSKAVHVHEGRIDAQDRRDEQQDRRLDRHDRRLNKLEDRTNGRQQIP